MASKILDNGTVVAFTTPEHSWIVGTVASYDVRSKLYTCQSKDPSVVADRIPNTADRLWAPRVEYLEEDVNDLLQLTELHEASLLFCLKCRFMRNVVYTNIGPIVVAVNPFTTEIPWYKESKMADYIQEGVVVERNLPHSWAVAHNTYWELRENSQNQTVLISGESGAGKTEAAKMVAKYLGAVSTEHGTMEQKEAMSTVNRKILASSPILESFGNAKTVRNDNSSRFGKFAKLQFDRDGFLVGCHVTKYLLEKSRIINAAANERVYHSFYQLAQGEAAKRFNIRSAKIFRVLNAGGCLTIDGVDDAQEFVATQQAMDDVGISETEREMIFRIVAGILYLQNLEFTETEERSGKVARIDTNLLTAVTRACELWEVQEDKLVSELTTNAITARGEVTVRLYNKAQAQDMRDSVSKSLYDWLFNWLVDRINSTTNVDHNCKHWIGLLDIFGFEDFKFNSFEQLCINTANENLQNHYNWHIFTEDMRECREEGIDTTAVQFVDNKGCLELLMGKTGIFALLDEECAKPSGNEKNFLVVINERFGGTKQKGGDPYFAAATGKAMDNHFRIKHYAAEVQYCVDNFLDKNRETIKEAMKRVLKASTMSLLTLLVPPLEDPTARPAARITVSGYFIKQLQELMTVINSTNPHWIRCIKPHPNRLPLNFSNAAVMSQLRSAGVLDTVKVRKAGYPIRFTNSVFVQRYRILSEGVPITAATTHQHIIEGIFKRLNIDRMIGQLGKTKVFLRQEAFSKLNHSKDEAMLKHASLLQALGRGSRVRAELFEAYVHLHRARILEARRQREEALRKQREEEERRRRAEEEERERVERMMKQQKYRAAVTLQRMVRGMLARAAVVRHYLESFRAREESGCDAELQKLRSQFAHVDRRVKQLEERHMHRAKINAQLNANEALSSDLLERRKRLTESRDRVAQRLEEHRKALDMQRQRDIAADARRRREEKQSEAAKRAEDQQHAAERKRQAKMAKEAAEEKAAYEFQRRQHEAAIKRAAQLKKQEELEHVFRMQQRGVTAVAAAVASTSLYQPPGAYQANDVGRMFDAARDAFVCDEWWEDARELRFRDVTLQSMGIDRHGSRDRGTDYVPAAPRVANSMTLGLSPKEQLLENAFRQRKLEEAELRSKRVELNATFGR